MSVIDFFSTFCPAKKFGGVLWNMVLLRGALKTKYWIKLRLLTEGILAPPNFVM